MNPRYDLVIVGGGPGGYVSAIRAAQLGLRTAIVEREEVGGTCLNWGCIPTKCLLRSAEILRLVRRSDEFGVHCSDVQADLGTAIDRSRQVAGRLAKGVRFLLKKNGVDLIPGHAVLSSPSKVLVTPGGQELEARFVLLAPGGVPKTLPGLEIDGDRVIGSRQALLLREPPKSIVVIGGGAIGVEFAYLYNTFGSKVTIVEMMPNLLPSEDTEISGELEGSLARQGITVAADRRFEGLDRTSTTVGVRVSSHTGSEVIEGEKLLVAVGVVGNTQGLGLEHVGIETARGFIAVNERLETSVKGVYAIGDVTGKLMLAHVASAQGEIAVETMAGHSTLPLDYDRIPRATYCDPQVASVGITEREARERGHDVQVGRFSFRGSGKAAALGEEGGRAKLIVDSGSGEILGAHLVGADVTELLPEICLAQALEATSAEIARAVHAHPTLSEAIREAALSAEGRAVHA